MHFKVDYAFVIIFVHDDCYYTYYIRILILVISSGLYCNHDYDIATMLLTMVTYDYGEYHSVCM